MTPRGNLWGLLACLLLSSAVVAVDPPAKLPCQSDAQCALRLAREAATRRALSTTQDSTRRRALNVMLWTAENERDTDPRSLLPVFKSLRTRIEGRASAESRPRELSRLARVMASYGLLDEARLLAKQLDDAGELDGVNVAAAGYLARRGRVREAFEVARAMPQDGIPFRLAVGGALNGVASTGKPDLTREIPRDLPGFDDSVIPVMGVMALYHAGQHEAARAEAQQFTDSKARMGAFLLLYQRHKDFGPREQFLPTARALYRSMLEVQFTAAERMQFPADRMRKEATKMLLEAMGENERSEELALIEQLPKDERASELEFPVGHLQTAEQVRAASKIIAGLAADEREALESAMLVSRIRVGELSAAAALEQAEEPAPLFDALIQLAYEFADAKQDAKARGLIQAVVASASEYPDEVSWSSVAHAQIHAGLLDDAAKTIDRKLGDPSSRVSPLLALSIAQAKAGQKAEAARSRARAEEEYRSFAEGGTRFGGIAMEYWKLDMFDEAEAELRRQIAAKAPSEGWKSLGISLVGSRARTGNLAGALDFARHLSANLDDDPEPFVRLFIELHPGMEPSSGELPWAPIRADMDMLGEME